MMDWLDERFLQLADFCNSYCHVRWLFDLAYVPRRPPRSREDPVMRDPRPFPVRFCIHAPATSYYTGGGRNDNDLTPAPDRSDGFPKRNC
jgi:hypothetical protein